MSEAARGKRIVALEPDYNGHRMSFVRHLVDEFGSGRVVIASSREGLVSKEFTLRFPDPSRVKTIDVGSLVKPRQPGYGQYIGKAAKKVRHLADDGAHIIILEGDPVLPHTLFWSRRLLQGLILLVIRPPKLSQSPVRSVAKALLMHVARIRGARLVCLVPATRVAPTYTVGSFPGTPDPVDLHHGSSKGASSLNEAPDAVRTIGIFGNIGQRKNPKLVAESMLAAGCTQGYRLLLAGKVAPESLVDATTTFGAFEAAGGRLIVQDRLLSDRELDEFIASVDLAVFAHSGDGPSQIFGRALALGVPVLAAGSRVLRSEVARLGRGRWVPLTLSALASALADEDTYRRASPVAFADGRDFARALVRVAR